MPALRSHLTALKHVCLLGALAFFGCGRSDHHHDPAAPRAGGSSDAGDTGVVGSGDGGTGGMAQTGGSSGADSLGGAAGLSGAGGSSNAAGRGGSANAARGGSGGALPPLGPHALAATPHGTCALDAAGK